jgi:general secretion pathway protein D
MASAPELKSIRRIVHSLDVPLPAGSSKINVYPLKHANAEELLPVLADLIGARSAGGGGRNAIRAARREPGNQRRNRSRNSSDRSGSNGRAPGSPSSTGSSRTAPSGVSGSDPATNSLIISASPQDFSVLQNVIEQLDVRRRQVYVEAIILEVSVDRIRQLGIEMQGGFSIAGQGVGLGRVNLGSLNQAISDPGSLSGLLLAAATNQTIQLPDGTSIPAKIALLRAAQGNRDINVLSAPTLLTTDNEEAEILVGQNVPFVASRATNATQLDNLFATVERRDVGINLRLTQQISEGDHVRLSIYEEVSAIVPTSPAVGDPNLVGPTTSIRSATTTVVVKDKQTVVIGGLISDDTIRQRESVPYLGDIPVLGNFFRNTEDSSSKINLLIFLTPHIVRDDVEVAQHSVTERDRFGGFLERHKAPAKLQRQLDKSSFQLLPDAQDEQSLSGGGVLLPGTARP